LVPPSGYPEPGANSFSVGTPKLWVFVHARVLA
jgi:hypothetical protein